jgi:hypothetical protein
MDRSIRFSIVRDLQGRFAPNHLTSARMKGNRWLGVLLELKAFWKMEVETILETRFYEPFDKN